MSWILRIQDTPLVDAGGSSLDISLPCLKKLAVSGFCLVEFQKLCFGNVYLYGMLRKWFRTLACVAAFAASASALSYDQTGLFGMRYGPNCTATLLGNTPFVTGQWLPQAMGAINYNWLEPMGESLPYGTPIDVRAAFLRMQAGLELSPFYEDITLGLGIRPFPINPQVEFRFVYSNLIYFNTNVEMAMSVENEAEVSIAENWNSKYILDNLYDGRWQTIDYAQSFTFGADLDYLTAGGLLFGVSFNFVLVDIETNYDGKSYDYQRNMPIFSRDYILETSLYGHYPINEHWAVLYLIEGYRSGVSKSSKGNILKESLTYAKALAGGVYSWNEGKQRVTVAPGVFARSKKRFYNGSIAQQFIIQLQYQYRFGFFDNGTD